MDCLLGVYRKSHHGMMLGHNSWIERHEVHLVILFQDLVAPLRYYWNVFIAFSYYFLLLLATFYALDLAGHVYVINALSISYGSFMQPCSSHIFCIIFGWSSFIEIPLGLWLKDMQRL